MELRIIPVSDTNREEILHLKVAPGQEHFIETVDQCLTEAGQNKNWRPVGIYDGGTPVGFSMYGFFLQEYLPDGRLWLDRLLIDSRFQGRGYGKTAMKELLARLHREYPGQKRIYLSVYRKNQTAIRLYEQFGFRFSGEKDVHGEDVMIRLD